MKLEDLLRDECFGEEDDEKDLFLRCDWQFANEQAAILALRQFGLDRFVNKGLRRARLMLIACALAYYDAGKWIAYSRYRNRYTGMTRYFGKAYNCGNIIIEIEKLTAKNLFDHDLMPPGSHRLPDPRQSSFRATQKLFEAMQHLKLVPDQHEAIRLRQLFDRETGKICFRKKLGGKYVSRLIKYDDTDQTRTYRREIDPINEFLKTVQLRWPGMESRRVGLYNKFDDHGVLTTPLTIYRTFCRNNFELYGRFHGFWQNESLDTRSMIELNGEVTCEPDFKQLHLNLAYLSQDLDPPEDGYEISGYDAKMIKTAVSILLNASCEFSARWALSYEFGIEDYEAQDVIDVVKEKHLAIKSMFHTDQGVKLMHIDSNILQEAMEMLVEERIAFLPVHDSIRVGKSNVDKTIDIMQEAFRSVYPAFKQPVKVKL